MCTMFWEKREMLLLTNRYIYNSQSDQLSVSLIAQLVGQCTVITEVMGLNPVQA